MNSKAITLLKNFWYAIISNLISLIISILVVLIVPKFISVESYGYWQIYLFYSTYVGFLHFGWNDGIYLRYGGEEYEKLNKNVFFSQFWQLFFFQAILFSIGIIISYIFIVNDTRAFIFSMVSIVLVIVNVKLMLVYILQATNRMKFYANVLIIERVLYCVLLFLLILLGVDSFAILVLADLVGKLISLIVAMYYCRDLVFNRLSSFKLNFKEILININIGSKLMIANIASLFILGLVRFGIERNWDVETFGKISLTLSISNFMMVFITAIGIVLFPILRRVDNAKLANIYTVFRNFLGLILFFFLLVYFPLYMILDKWLPEYRESLTYMSLLFPMCIFEGKMVLLINTYLKTLRKEKIIMKVNVLTMLLSLISTLFLTLVVQNLTLLILSIVILLAFRSIVAELILSRIINIKVGKYIILEIIMSLLFIVATWYLEFIEAFIFYLIFYIMYLIITKNENKRTIFFLKSNLKI